MAAVSTPIPTSLHWAHPLVQEWFVHRFSTPTEPQEQGWPHIVAGRATLISAPTGSGKTLAAFLACIDSLVRSAIAGDLLDQTRVLYVSPLKALGNDIQKNLEAPLGEILQLAAARGMMMPPIRTAVRTGDTLQHERRAMLKRPPHILVTTPESLYILLTADKSRAILRDVETVIVDEIHAVADDKRGAHLALSLERLEALTHKPPVRIGLSATQKPISLVAQFLTGMGRPEPIIVNIGNRRSLDFRVEVPCSELGPVASNEMWDEIYDRIAGLVREHRSTLIFVNTRRLAERVSHNLAARLGEEAVAAHHGSLSRKIRLAAEHQLKSGQVQALVATASLELGIDIGTVDLVCHISSPRSIGVTLQRIGRSGHWRGAVPKGRIFATTRDELLECAALVSSVRHGELDRLYIPEMPLDVLAQQIVAMCAAEEWKEEELFTLLRRAYPYRNLLLDEFNQILELLSAGIVSGKGRYGAHLFRDSINHRLRGRRGARLVAITNGGAIPDNALYTVVAEPEGIVVGTIDEDFAVESLKGDIMLLGNTSWRILRVEGAGRVLVEDAHGAAPSIPFWRGEAPARTAELSAEVAAIRKKISDLTPTLKPDRAAGYISNHHPEAAAAIEWLQQECGLDSSGAEQALAYVLEGRAILGEVPTQQTIIAERFFDEGGGMQLVIHAPFGGAITKAWGLALRKRFCRSFNFELQAAATDNGLNISLSDQHSFPLADVFQFLQPETVTEVLEQAVLAAPVFNVRWRWDAQRALALQRFRNGKKVPPQIQRMRADDLLAAVFPEVAACQENIEGDIKIPDHPLIREVMKDVMSEAMDLEGLRNVLHGIRSGEIRCLSVDTPQPSQFSHEILNANPYAYLDDAPLEERRARAVEMRRSLPPALLSEVGRLDPAAIAEVRASAWPDVRDADELQDALHTFIALPEARLPRPLELLGTPLPRDVWGAYFEHLREARRAVRAVVSGIAYWISAEKLPEFKAVFKDAEFFGAASESSGVEGEGSEQGKGTPVDSNVAGLPAASPSRDDSLLAMVTGWMMHSGPVKASHLGSALGVPTSEIDKALLRMEAAGSILRGHFEDMSAPSGAALGSLMNGSATNGAGNGAMQPAKEKPGAAQAASSGALEAGAVGGGDPKPGDPKPFDPDPVDPDPSDPEPGESGIEWCDRRLLARIHRLTLGALRKQIEPITAAQFMRWLLRWQHVAPGTQQAGERGTLEVLHQLQGFEISANAWEKHILPRRIAHYDPKILDQLCLTGAVGWGRLSPHPATLREKTSEPEPQVSPSRSHNGAADNTQADIWSAGGAGIASPLHADSKAQNGVRKPARAYFSPGANSPPADGSARVERQPRVVPTSVAPITFFLRNDADWMQLRTSDPASPQRWSVEGCLSRPARQVYEFLGDYGASFFADIVNGTGRLKAEIETALWELVAAGLVTADGFDNLRTLIDPRRRNGSRGARPRHSTGRWSLLQPKPRGPASKHQDHTLDHTLDLESGRAGKGRSAAHKKKLRAANSEPDALPGGALSPRDSEQQSSQSSPQSFQGSAAPPQVREPKDQRAAALEATCRMLLARYGVVFREVVARESILPRWRELLIAFRRLEDRGEVRGGRFVSGFIGEQYALPEAVESLRLSRKLPPESETVSVSAADPLNLVGIIVPGERVPAISGRQVSFRDGAAVPDALLAIPSSEAQQAAQNIRPTGT